VGLGIIARCDNTGLGNQTLELVRMLDPDKVLVIDSTPFNKNKQYPERYQDRRHRVVSGFPTSSDITNFLSGIDVVISCETFYHKKLVDMARKKKVRTILQYNFEFFGGFLSLQESMPTVLLAPSMWRIDEMRDRFGSLSKIEFLPPPTDAEAFNKNMVDNIRDSRKLLHIAGKAAAHDRNGTKSVIEMLKYSESDYDLVIKSQTPLDIDCDDVRLTVKVSNEDNNEDLYHGFDAMVLPRRYAGLCLPMNEALLSGLPVFMTDISPNNLILPKKWLAKSEIIGNFMAKKVIDIYDADPRDLAEKIDQYFDASNKKSLKEEAFFLGYETFSQESLRQKYIDLINSV